MSNSRAIKSLETIYRRRYTHSGKMKDIVERQKPHHILTHVIDGFVIQESQEPFPVQSSSLLTEFSPLERGQVSMETNNGSSGMPVSPVLFPEASAYPSVRQKGNPLNRKEWILSGRLSDNMSSMVNLPEHHPEEAIVQTEPQPSNWNVEEVYEFIKALPRCAPYAEEFRSKEIDGIALMLLKEYHLLGIMNIKLGPALKICEKISSLKEAHDSKVGR